MQAVYLSRVLYFFTCMILVSKILLLLCIYFFLLGGGVGNVQTGNEEARSQERWETEDTGESAEGTNNQS